AGGLDVSTLLVGTADFLIDEARQQIETYVMQAGAQRICGPGMWLELLPSTCALVHSGSAPPAAATSTGAPGAATADSLPAPARRPQNYFPGIETLRDALRQDLRNLPFTVGETALRAHASRGSRAVQERAVLGLFLLDYVREMGQARTPLVALQRAEQTLLRGLPANVSLRALDVGPRIRQAAAVGGLLNSAREDLAAYWQGGTLADSAALYTIKALALNVAADSTLRAELGLSAGLAQHLDQALNAVVNAQGLLTSIESTWARLRDVATDSAGKAARGGLVAQLAGDAVDLAFVALPDSGDSLWTGLRRLADPASELMTALGTERPADALTGLLHLSQAVENLGILSSSQLRALAFTTDVAQAQNPADVQAAFERLVGSGPGYQGKRHATAAYWRVNAYAGLSSGPEFMADADSVGAKSGWTLGLALPIGIEVGWPVGTASSWGIFVQLVDLGAIASARLAGTEDLETFPEFSFGSVIAPGVFGVRSIGSTPFSLLAGAAFVPQARETEAGKEVGGIRVTAGVAVDIPLFP
ncbi:MAG TPA: hypothetical protein VNP72_08520, partial [Longimicrobium sp.]|nr:hypothetical protein [Longimicrobium sp.]